MLRARIPRVLGSLFLNIFQTWHSSMQMMGRVPGEERLQSRRISFTCNHVAAKLSTEVDEIGAILMNIPPSKQEIPLNKWRAAAASASQPRTRPARTARDIYLVMEQLDNNMDCCVAFDRNNLTPHYSPDTKSAALLLDFVSNRSQWYH